MNFVNSSLNKITLEIFRMSKFIRVKKQKFLGILQKAFKETIFPYFNPKTANHKIMTKLLPKELAQAKELMDQAKFGEALEIVETFEKGESLAPEDKLSALLFNESMKTSEMLELDNSPALKTVINEIFAY